MFAFSEHLFRTKERGITALQTGSRLQRKGMQCLLPSSKVLQGFLDSQSNPPATTQHAVKARSCLTHIALCPKTRILLGIQTSSSHTALKPVSKPRKTSPKQFPQSSESRIIEYKMTAVDAPWSLYGEGLSRDHGQDCFFQQLTHASSSWLWSSGVSF